MSHAGSRPTTSVPTSCSSRSRVPSLTTSFLLTTLPRCPSAAVSAFDKPACSPLGRTPLVPTNRRDPSAVSALQQSAPEAAALPGRRRFRARSQRIGLLLAQPGQRRLLRVVTHLHR